MTERTASGGGSEKGAQGLRGNGFVDTTAGVLQCVGAWK